jgi:hypothetical protein
MFKINITKLPDKYRPRAPENQANKKICIKQYTIVEMNPIQSNDNNNNNNNNNSNINTHRYYMNNKI